MITYVYLGIAVILSMSVHEMAHGLVSYWMGDPTPKEQGRLTLNPFNHIDWVGVLCLMFFHFGWAKPVPVNTRYYKDPKTGMIWTAFAGPLANFLLAFIALGIQTFSFTIGNYSSLSWLWQLCTFTSMISLGLGLFNLLPIPPLDGSKVLLGFLPDEQYFKWVSYNSPWVMMILIGLLYSGVLTQPLIYAESAIHSWMMNFWASIFF